MKIDIRNRVIRQELVDWRNLEWIQGSLKEMTEENFQKLLQSIRSNGIVKPFTVWENEGKIYCLDGNHLKKALEQLEKEKMILPKMLPADFIECKDMKEAKRLVLVYSAWYARITDEGLYDFLHTNDLASEFENLKLELSLPEIDLEDFEAGWIKDDILNENKIRDNEINTDNLKIENKCPKCGYEW